MFSDSQTLTANAVNTVLTRVGYGDRKGVFENATSGDKLTISHTFGKRFRRQVRHDKVLVTADPLIAGVSRNTSYSVYTVVDFPSSGVTPAMIEDALEQQATWLAVQANRDKLVNGES